MKNERLTVCGVRCSTDCKAFGKECAGCIQLGGKVSWAKFYGKEHCPIYDCVKENKFNTCADCGRAPCQVWMDTRNPDTAEEEFQADINSRLENLKTINK